MTVATVFPWVSPSGHAAVDAPDWSPDSWTRRPAQQQVEYADPAALAGVIEQIGRLPPLVTSWEIEQLRGELARAARGEAFVLQGGDCAESFDDCRSEPIAAKLKILLQMSLVLVHGTRKPVVRIGRIAGQYAKPRSADVETRGDVTLPAYRGDLINRDGFTAADRTPDPALMLRAYERAGLTLNFIRALVDGGFADLHHPEYWDISFAHGSPHAAQYERIVESIRESLDFVSAITGVENEVLRRVDIYTSHEALALPYEQAQTRRVPRRPGWYNLSTHFPWIGMRTAQLDGAHVEFHRGIQNPLGIKIGPAMTTEWLIGLLDALDPQRRPGRITLIHRMGAGQVAGKLPPLVEAVRRAGREVLWICDPMHGNTETTATGIKTRRFDRIVDELEQSFALHTGLGSRLGGVHIELTGEDVTECTGGARGLSDAGLERAYKSRVDPRLNYEQALECAMRIARHLRGGK
jgi:3-deoxy-7-phosphoheptulonate synthase